MNNIIKEYENNVLDRMDTLVKSCIEVHYTFKNEATKKQLDKVFSLQHKFYENYYNLLESDISINEKIRQTTQNE